MGHSFAGWQAPRDLGSDRRLQCVDARSPSRLVICPGARMPSGLAPTHPRATMQKHEKKRVAGGASCNCLKTKGQICNHERGNLEVASDSWREKEEEKEMKWRRGEGSQVWQTQELRERGMGSVAMIGGTGDFSEVWQIQ